MNKQESRSAKSFHKDELPAAQASYLGRICQVIPTGKTYKCVEDSTGEPTVSETHSPALGTVTINKTKIATKLHDAGVYVFDADVDVKHIIATYEGIDRRFNYYPEGITDVYEAWRDLDGEVVYTSTSDPNEGDTIYKDGGVEVGAVVSYADTVTAWELGSTVVNLTQYGISYTGTAEDGNAIFVTFAPAPTTYTWEEVLIEVGGVEDSLENHLNSLRNDLGELGDVVADRIPPAPDEEGDYILHCSVTSSGKSYSWVEAE